MAEEANDLDAVLDDLNQYLKLDKKSLDKAKKQGTEFSKTYHTPGTVPHVCQHFLTICWNAILYKLLFLFFYNVCRS